MSSVYDFCLPYGRTLARLRVGKKACFCSSRRTLVLHDACVANDLNAVMTIVRRGYVDLNEQDKEGYSAVEHMVVRRCDFDDVLKAVHLFSKCDGKVDVSRVEALALQNGCSNVARYCGWIGAEGREERWNAYADLRFAYGAYPLHVASGEKSNLADVKVLVETCGQGVNEIDGDGKTPVYRAAYHDKKDVVRYLMSKGAKEEDKKRGNRMGRSDRLKKKYGSCSRFTRAEVVIM